MKQESRSIPSLREMELEVEAEGREWMRRGLRKSLQAQTTATRSFPPRATQGAPSAAADDAATHGLRRGRAGGVARKNPADGTWGIPIRQQWGLGPHQQLSPALGRPAGLLCHGDRLVCGGRQAVGQVGCPVEDSTLQALVQRLGARAEAQTQARLAQTPVEKSPVRAPTALAVLMVDGFQVRFRGPGWGKRRTAQPRVEWHEEKLGVFYRHEQRCATGGENSWKKVVVSWQGEGLELGRRLHWEALRADWAARGTCWSWPMARRGSGT